MRSRLEAGLLVAGLIGALLLPRHVGGDDLVRLDALSRLLERGEILPTGYSLVGPLFSAPLWLLGKELGPSPARWLAFHNLVLFVAGLGALNWLLRGEIPDRVRRQFLLLLFFGSMFPHHLQHYGAEVFTALLAAIGILLLTLRGSSWGWVCLILAAVNTPAVLGALAIVVVWQALQTRQPRTLLVLGVALSAFLVESWLRRGSVTTTGYENNAGHRTLLPYSALPGFSYPFFFGLLGILFSFGKGLLFFTPGLFCPGTARGVSPRMHRGWHLWLVFVLGLVLVYSRWWAWYGGWTWGPRFFLFASVPASFALALVLHESSRRGLGWNLFGLLALALSFWVSYNGLAIGGQNLEVCLADNYALEHLAWHVPEFSVLWRPFIVAPVLSTRAKLVGGLYLCCFAYLAYPLLRECLRQGWALGLTWWAGDNSAPQAHPVHRVG